MIQDIHKQYEIEFDYDNESVQNDYYKRAKGFLNNFDCYQPYSLILSVKAKLLKQAFGEDSKYYKYCTRLTDFNLDMVDYLSKNEVHSVSVIEEYNKTLSCCFKDVYVNGKKFPCRWRSYLNE